MCYIKYDYINMERVKRESYIALPTYKPFRTLLECHSMLNRLFHDYILKLCNKCHGIILTKILKIWKMCVREWNTRYNQNRHVCVCECECVAIYLFLPRPNLVHSEFAPS
jgi:hypothetical protein